MGVSGDFAHLHVASGFSMRYGTSTPAALVERAAQHGQPVLALTDRDGLYGAVRFVQAATEAGIAPVLGVDLAVGPEPHPWGDPRRPGPVPSWSGAGSERSRTPVRGGADRDPRHPRVTVLARGHGAGVPAGVGWASLCRLVTDTHLRGERGRPVSTPLTIAGRCLGGDGGAGGGAGTGGEGGGGSGTSASGTRGGGAGSGPPASPLVVLLGPDSDVGRALLARRPDQARALLRAWQQLLPGDALAIEVVCHGGPEGTPASRGHAARLLGLADESGLPAVLTAAVRHVDPGESAVVDVLDAARRLVVLDTRHLDRVTDAAHLASTPAMHAVALAVTSGDRARADA
ncbi:MAG TPA: PHP domain-containing protein, partial [Pedococcus sp.]